MHKHTIKLSYPPSLLWLVCAQTHNSQWHFNKPITDLTPTILSRSIYQLPGFRKAITPKSSTLNHPLKIQQIYCNAFCLFYFFRAAVCLKVIYWLINVRLHLLCSRKWLFNRIYWNGNKEKNPYKESYTERTLHALLLLNCTFSNILVFTCLFVFLLVCACMCVHTYIHT